MHVANGDALPPVHGVVDGETVDLAELAAGSWSLVLLFRGHW